MSMPQRKDAIKIGCLCSIIFLAAFSLFLGCFYLKASLDGHMARFMAFCKARGIGLEGLETACFPPSVRVAKLILPPDGKGQLVLENLELGPALFPPGIVASAALNGAGISMRLALASLSGPSFSRLSVRADNLPLAAAGFFLDNDYLSIAAGSMDIRGHLQAGSGGGLFDIHGSSGKLAARVRDATVQQSTPFLTAPEIAGINGRLDLELKPQACELSRGWLSAEQLEIRFSGGISHWLSPGKERIDITATARPEPGLLAEELLPIAARERMRQTGQLAIHISGTFNHPAFELAKNS